MFRARAADQAHAASAPDTAWPVHRVTARLIPGAGQGPPVSMPLDLTALQRRRSAKPSARPGASGASSWSPPDAIFRAFPLSLTTTVFSQRSTGWFDACPRRPTPEGQPSSISRTAPLQKDLLHGPPSTFMTHRPLSVGVSPADATHRCRTGHMTRYVSSDPVDGRSSVRSPITADQNATSPRKAHASGVHTGALGDRGRGRRQGHDTGIPLQCQLPDDCSGGTTA